MTLRPALSLLLIGPLLFGGCYLSHERGGETDAAPRADAGRDAGPDAGPPEPPACHLEPRAELLPYAPRGHSTKNPDLYWDGRELGVVVAEMDGDIPHPVVGRVRAAPDLSSAGEARAIGPESHGWGEGAWTEAGLAFCYYGDPGGRGRTLFRLERPDGSLGPLVDLDAEGSSCLDLAVSGDRLLASWRHWVEVPEGADPEMETWLRVLDLEGAPISEPIVVARDLYPGRTALLFGAEAGFYAAVAETSGRVVVREISLGGEVLRERSLPTEDARLAAVAASAGRVAVAWLAGPRDTRSLHVQVLDASLAPLGEARTLADGAPPATGPSLTPLSSGWALSWAAGTQPSFYAVLAHLDHDGRPVEPRRVVFTGTNSSYGGPSLLPLGADLYLGLSQQEPDFYEQVHLRRFTCEEGAYELCAPQDARSGDCLGEVLYGWRWDGEACAPVIGCEGDCMGAGCERLSPTRFACEADHEACGPPAPRCEGALLELEPGAVCGPTELQANRPERMELRSEMSACEACGLTLGCVAEVAGPFALRLRAEACRADIDCDCDPTATVTLSATCHLPPLSQSTWAVEVTGGRSFEVVVRPVWEEPIAEPLCR